MRTCSRRWEGSRGCVSCSYCFPRTGRPGVGEILSGLGIPNSTLSHHLENLKIEGLVKVRRDSEFLWYSADTESLRELLDSYDVNRKQKYFNKSQAASRSCRMLRMDASAL